MWCLRFYGGFKAFIKPFETPKRSVEIKISLNFFSSSGFGTGKVKIWLRKNNLNILLQCRFLNHVTKKFSDMEVNQSCARRALHWPSAMFRIDDFKGPSCVYSKRLRWYKHELQGQSYSFSIIANCNNELFMQNEWFIFFISMTIIKIHAVYSQTFNMLGLN